jgi:hypothetical protein
LRGVRLDYCRGGLVDMTRGRLPRAGEHQGPYYSMGYSGHGAQMAVYMGQRMAEVMGGNPAANPWRDLRWPPIPGYFGWPWFLPLVGRTGPPPGRSRGRQDRARARSGRRSSPARWIRVFPPGGTV